MPRDESVPNYAPSGAGRRCQTAADCRPPMLLLKIRCFDISLSVSREVPDGRPRHSAENVPESQMPPCHSHEMMGAMLSRRRRRESYGRMG